MKRANIERTVTALEKTAKELKDELSGGYDDMTAFCK